MLLYAQWQPNLSDFHTSHPVSLVLKHQCNTMQNHEIFWSVHRSVFSLSWPRPNFWLRCSWRCPTSLPLEMTGFFFFKGSFWKMVLGKLWWCGRILARNGVCTPTGETKHSGKKSKSKWDKFNKNQQRRDWPPDCLPSHEVILNCHLFFYKILLKKKKCQNHPNIYFFTILSHGKWSSK